jgi:hypothetical protein
MSEFFKYGKLSTVSIITHDNKLKNYDDYKKKIIEDLKRHVELIEDPGKRILTGSHKDPGYMTKLSVVADDLSVIELTLRCKRKLFDFGAKGEKYFRFSVPIESRNESAVKAIRLSLLNELISKVEANEYKTHIKVFLRNH